MTPSSLRSLASILGTFALTLSISTAHVASASPHGREATPCGPSFQVVNSPDPAPIGILEDVAAISASDVWAVGGNDIEHWDGAQWSVVPSPPRAYLFAVAAASSGDVWAIGANSGFAYTVTLHWDGANWSKVPSPNTGGVGNELRDVAVVATDDVWAVGFSANNVGGSMTLIEHWDGARWTIVPSPSPGNATILNGVTAVSANDIWAVGSYKNKPLVEHWDGTLWSLVFSPYQGHGSASLIGAAAVSSDDVWAVGFTDGNTSNLVEHWDGTGWTVVASPPGNTGLTDLAAVSAADIWATGSANFPISVIHWDGIRWSAVNVPNMNGDSQLRSSGVGALPTGETWIVGFDASSGTTMKQHMCPTQVLDSGFAPAASDVTRGMSASWVFPAGNVSSHTVTDDTGLGLFDSGPRLPGTSFIFRFAASGTYSIVDALFPGHTETIGVPTEAEPPTGSITTSFQIAWSAAVLPAPYVFDVQVMRPGNPSWADWQVGVVTMFATFTPDSGQGVYSFRARLRDTGNGASSDWSPTASITVTP